MADLLHVPLPNYKVLEEPDHEKVGIPVDSILFRHFANDEIVIRCLSSQEHPFKTVNTLIEIIQTVGTDRYDPNRKGDRYENVENEHIDFFALKILVNGQQGIFEQFTYPFYHWGKRIQGIPVRLDLMLIYDPKQLIQVFHHYKGRSDEKSDGWRFRQPGNPSQALRAILKIS